MTSGRDAAKKIEEISSDNSHGKSLSSFVKACIKLHDSTSDGIKLVFPTPDKIECDDIRDAQFDFSDPDVFKALHFFLHDEKYKVGLFRLLKDTTLIKDISRVNPRSYSPKYVNPLIIAVQSHYWELFEAVMSFYIESKDRLRDDEGDALALKIGEVHSLYNIVNMHELSSRECSQDALKILNILLSNVSEFKSGEIFVNALIKYFNFLGISIDEPISFLKYQNTYLLEGLLAIFEGELPEDVNIKTLDFETVFYLLEDKLLSKGSRLELEQEAKNASDNFSENRSKKDWKVSLYYPEAMDFKESMQVVIDEMSEQYDTPGYEEYMNEYRKRSKQRAGDKTEKEKVKREISQLAKEKRDREMAEKEAQYKRQQEQEEKKREGHKRNREQEYSKERAKEKKYQDTSKSRVSPEKVITRSNNKTLNDIAEKVEGLGVFSTIDVKSLEKEKLLRCYGLNAESTREEKRKAIKKDILACHSDKFKPDLKGIQEYMKDEEDLRQTRQAYELCSILTVLNSKMLS